MLINKIQYHANRTHSGTDACVYGNIHCPHYTEQLQARVHLAAGECAQLTELLHIFAV